MSYSTSESIKLKVEIIEPCIHKVLEVDGEKMVLPLYIYYEPPYIDSVTENDNNKLQTNLFLNQKYIDTFSGDLEKVRKMFFGIL